HTSVRDPEGRYPVLRLLSGANGGSHCGLWLAVAGTRARVSVSASCCLSGCPAVGQRWRFGTELLSEGGRARTGSHRAERPTSGSAARCPASERLKQRVGNQGA